MTIVPTETPQPLTRVSVSEHFVCVQFLSTCSGHCLRPLAQTVSFVSFCETTETHE